MKKQTSMLVSVEDIENYGDAVIDLTPLPDGTFRATILEDMTSEEVAALDASRNAPSPVPASISDRQFAHALKKQGIITHEEALVFVKAGELPAALAVIVAGIKDQEAREDAELLLSGAVEFHRAHPLTAAVAQAYGWGDQETDNFFRAAAEL